MVAAKMNTTRKRYPLRLLHRKRIMIFPFPSLGNLPPPDSSLLALTDKRCQEHVFAGELPMNTFLDRFNQPSGSHVPLPRNGIWEHGIVSFAKGWERE